MAYRYCNDCSKPFPDGVESQRCSACKKGALCASCYLQHVTRFPCADIIALHSKLEDAVTALEVEHQKAEQALDGRNGGKVMHVCNKCWILYPTYPSDGLCQCGKPLDTTTRYICECCHTEHFVSGARILTSASTEAFPNDGTCIACGGALEPYTETWKWRARTARAEKWIGWLLGIGVCQVPTEAARRCDHPAGLAESCNRGEWDRVNIRILKGALARLETNLAKWDAGENCDCARCNDTEINLDSDPPDIVGRKYLVTDAGYDI